jgi:hypothetical protein
MDFQTKIEHADHIIYGQIIVYCEQVLTGTKLIAKLDFNRIYLEMVKKTIKKEKCHAIYRSINKEMSCVIIYKYDFVAILIEQLLLRKKVKITVLDIWATGKMFGYSNYEIGKYLKGHGVVKN